MLARCSLLQELETQLQQTRVQPASQPAQVQPCSLSQPGLLAFHSTLMLPHVPLTSFSEAPALAQTLLLALPGPPLSVPAIDNGCHSLSAGQQRHVTTLTSTSANLMQGNKDATHSSPPSVHGLDESSSQKLQMAPARLLASPGTSIHASLQDPPGMQVHATSLVVQQLQQEVEELSVSWRCSVGSLLPGPACLPA